MNLHPVGAKVRVEFDAEIVQVDKDDDEMTYLFEFHPGNSAWFPAALVVTPVPEPTYTVGTIILDSGKRVYRWDGSSWILGGDVSHGHPRSKTYYPPIVPFEIIKEG